MNIEDYLKDFVRFRKYIPTQINLNGDFILYHTIYRLGKGEINASTLEECLKNYNKAWKKLFTLKIISKEEDETPVPLIAKKPFISFLEKSIVYDPKEKDLCCLEYDSHVFSFEKNATQKTFITAFDVLLKTQIPKVRFTETSPNDFTVEHEGYYQITREEVLTELYHRHAPEVVKQLQIIKATTDKALRFCEASGLITSSYVGDKLGLKVKYIPIIEKAFELLELNGAIAPIEFQSKQAQPWMRIFSNDPSREKSEYYRWVLKTKQGQTNKSAILYLFRNLYKLEVITTQNEFDIYKVLSSCFRDSENLILTFQKENYRNAKQISTSHGWLCDFVNDQIPKLKDNADRRDTHYENGLFV